MNLNQDNFSKLFTRLETLNFSVRSLYCLKKLGLTYIGELAQKEVFELIRIRNFGKKSLFEVKEILSAYGLRLGTKFPDWDTIRYQYEQDKSFELSSAQLGLFQSHADVKENFLEDRIDRTAFLNLFIKVSELPISARALNYLKSDNIVYVGDLVKRTEPMLLKKRNVGRKTVREIKSKLSQMGLSLGMSLPEWPQNKIDEEINLLSSELEMHRKNNLDLFLPDKFKHADFLEEELIYFVTLFTKIKYVPIVLTYFGFDGKGKRTLEEVGKEFGLTRERIRQICAKFLKKLNRVGMLKNKYLPICKNIEQYIMARLPAEVDFIEMALLEKGFTKNKFRLEGILEAIELSGGKRNFYITELNRKPYVIRLVEKRIPNLIIHLSKNLVSHYGITNVAEIVEQVFQETGQTLTDKYVISIISTFKDFNWLDETNGWFWLTSTSRNRILNIIQKILSVCENIDVHELRAGIGRHHRMNGFRPTTKVLLELCKQVSWCRIEVRAITANPSIKPEDVLASIELGMYEVLKERGPLMLTEDFEKACSDIGIKRNSFYQYLSYSPIIAKYITGVYGLRGANIPPGLVESIVPINKRRFSAVDYGRTKEGNIWIIRKLTPFIIRSGVFTIPANLNQYIQESFTLISGDGANFGTLQIKNNSARSVYNFLKRRGYETGDYLALTFDPNKKEAVAYIGNEEIIERFLSE